MGSTTFEDVLDRLYFGIQCKFYDPARTLDKKQIDSFFTAVGKADFSYGMVLSTTDKWSNHAEEALEGQSKAMTRRFAGLACRWTKTFSTATR